MYKNDTFIFSTIIWHWWAEIAGEIWWTFFSEYFLICLCNKGIWPLWIAASLPSNWILFLVNLIWWYSWYKLWYNIILVIGAQLNLRKNFQEFLIWSLSTVKKMIDYYCILNKMWQKATINIFFMTYSSSDIL